MSNLCCYAGERMLPLDVVRSMRAKQLWVGGVLGDPLVIGWRPVLDWPKESQDDDDGRGLSLAYDRPRVF
jgi:hypothetical protein